MPRIKNCKAPEILQVENTEEEPVVCVVCGRDDVGIGEMNKGVFTCWECMKKQEKPKRGNPHDQHGSVNPNFRHGMCGTRTYTTWENMKKRCLRPKNKDYKYYGGRGITICDEWHDFNNFFNDMGEKPEGKTLDRIDTDKDYCKENCRWSTRKEQQNNQRRTVRVVFNCEVTSLGYLSVELGINAGTLHTRIKSGWPEELWGDKPDKYKRLKKRMNYKRQEGEY